MNNHFRVNRDLWDEWAVIHERSDFYDVESFKEGRNTLTHHEAAELGDVDGKSLIHLMCHIGLDTMSLTRMGARAVGIDFSPRSIDVARGLAEEMNLSTTFLESDIYDLPELLAEDKYDIVYTSHGVLMWLPDLTRWARVVAGLLAPGGYFYLSEIHPFARTLTNGQGTPNATRPYFTDGAVEYETETVSYIDPLANPLLEKNFRWRHTLGDVVNAIVGAGLRIEFLHEWPFSTFQQLNGMEKGEDGAWHLPGASLPLLFSLKAHLPRA